MQNNFVSKNEEVGARLPAQMSLLRKMFTHADFRVGALIPIRESSCDFPVVVEKRKGP
jgi:hypothetical protein